MPSTPGVRAPWPDAVAYREAVQNPALSVADPELATASVVVDRLGLPVAYTGRFAAVFRLRDAVSGGEWALRCFTSPAEECERRRRYDAVARHLAAAPPAVAGAFVSFRYLPAGVLVAGRTYPALAMRWASGETVGRFVDRNAEADPAALLRLCESLGSLLRALEEAGIAHGDWQHDNLLVSDGGRRVTLVDYDGVYVPELTGAAAAEVGHPNYQHPGRALRPAGEALGPGGDRFAFLVMRAALLAVAHEPALWRAFATDGESLLFKAADLASPSASPVFEAVRRIGRRRPVVAEALKALERACAAEPAALAWGEAPAPLVARPEDLPAPAVSARSAAPGSEAAEWFAALSRDGNAAVGTVSAPPLLEAAARRTTQAHRALAQHRRTRRQHVAVTRFVLALLLLPAYASGFLGVGALVPAALLFGATLLLLLAYAAWPGRVGAALLLRLIAEHRSDYFPVKSRLQRRRLAVKRLNERPGSRSAVEYVTAVLRQTTVRDASVSLSLPSRDRDRLLLAGMETLADLPGELRGVAAPVSPEGRGRLYGLRAELVQAAREEFDALSDTRRRLLAEIDTLNRAAEGLQDAEDELERYARDFGDTRPRAFLAEVFSWG